ncbi:MAG: DsbA family protein [Longimicrobiales bacterium]
MVRSQIVRLAVFLVAGLCAVPAPAAAQGDTLFERASRSRMKGLPAAAVLVYEIADFQCPYCAEFAREVYPRIDSAYVATGKVQWVFVHLPMPNHAHAWAASEASLCAGAVANHFWPMHDRIFASQDEWTPSDTPAAIFARYADDLGVPAEAYDLCIRNDRVASLILADVIFAASSRASGIPMFIINNDHTVVGLKTFEEWRELLERELKGR